ncbi:MAG: T9SS type A sorting domain-containing protein [Candidatus Zixiibacteriota bacterium]|nr:MAG: T9SS type A sorting domain-containing protein [candidate division Zixibacteria bacterium]
MLKNSVLAMILVGLFCFIAEARIRHVPGEYPTIQDGINDCSGGDTLLVAPGIYYENINFNGQYLVLASKYITTGIQDYIDSTVIDGGGTGHAVIFQTGEDSRAVITGFTITNGYSDNGGGIYCENSSPVISHNKIVDNTTYTGFWPYGQGAGIYCENSEATIINNLIINNNASGTDGGRGGGIFCEYSSPDMINNTIFGNNAMWYGGAIFSNFSAPNITNCILWGNSAPEGSEIYQEGTPIPQVNYSDIYAGWPGQGNINANPEFRDRNQGDFHLMSTEYGFPYDSPCIDVGAPYIRDLVLDSLWGLGTISSDVGAYGGGDFELSSSDDEAPEKPGKIGLVRNYPNPFNSQTVVSFYLFEAGDVSIEIFDILGRSIGSLHDSYLEEGHHNIMWDGDDHSGGIYLYSVKGTSFNITKKMLLLK